MSGASGASKVEEGRAAPDFALPSSGGGEVRLSELRGRVVILYFYPRDNTPGCTREACEFRDRARALTKSGAMVLGVSPDSVASHERFRARHDLGFLLLSDPDKSVARLYGAFGEKSMYGKKVIGMIRSTFVIDTLGVVRKIFRPVRVDGHAAAVLAIVQGL